MGAVTIPGAAWAQSTAAVAPAEAGVVVDHPRVAVEARSGPDRVYVAFERRFDEQFDVFVAVSEDGGQSFAAPVRVNDDSGATDQRFPDIAVLNARNLIVVWQDERSRAPSADGPLDGNADVYFTLTTDGGLTYQANRRLHAEKRGAQARPRVAVCPGVKPVVAYMDGSRNDATNVRWDPVFSRSDDFGGRFSTPKVVREPTGAHDDAAVDPAIACSATPGPGGAPVPDDPGIVSISYTSVRNGLREIRLIRSENGGGMWGAPVRVAPSTVGAQSHSAVVSLRGQHFVAFADTRDTRASADPALSVQSAAYFDVFLAQDLEGRLQFPMVMRFGDTPRQDQLEPALTLDGAAPVMVWSDRRDLNGYRLYAQAFNESTQALGGAVGVAPDPQPGVFEDLRRPHAAMADGDLLVAYVAQTRVEEGGAPVSQIRLTRLPRARLHAPTR